MASNVQPVSVSQIVDNPSIWLVHSQKNRVGALRHLQRQSVISLAGPQLFDTRCVYESDDSLPRVRTIMQRLSVKCLTS